MNTILENLTGMGTMTDQIIASDLLIAAKADIKNYALALTETSSPQVRNVLRRHLDDAITSHERISNYMISRDWYHPQNIQQQIKLDIQGAQTMINLQS